ncbi:MAG TPA: hypothetical protein VFN22_04985 [Gemmatimonadales bacterium]|nr:hypothetical protein [Gemmatimonadales bacterium]
MSYPSGRKGGSGAATCRVGIPLALVPVADLIAHLESKLSVMRPYGGDVVVALEQVIRDVNMLAERFDSSILTLEQAARESGYAKHSIRRMMRQGKLQNVGVDRKPMVRRGELPRKPGLDSPPPRLQVHRTSRQQVARSLIEQGD